MNVSLPTPVSPVPASGRSGATTGTRPEAETRRASAAFEQALRAHGSRAQPMREQPEAGPGTDGDAGARVADPGRRGGRSGRGGSADAADGPDLGNGEREPGGDGPAPRSDFFMAPTASACAASAASRSGTTSAAPPDSGPTRTALEAALAMPSVPADAAATARWEVSIPQATGVPLELRAGRAPQADGPARWTLDIRSGRRDIQSLLAGSASRLSDRLQARALHAHVRIDSEDEEQAS